MSRTKKAVCFVDDDPEEIQRFRCNLEREFDIGSGTSLDEALNDLRAQGRARPNLFLLDLYFPEGPRNTEEELQELARARQEFLRAQAAFLAVLGRLGQSARGGFSLARRLQSESRVGFAFFTR